MTDLDRLDRKLLTHLQRDARLTNGELADLVGLSASQCSRRRSQLEKAGVISGYHARLDREQSGFGLTSIIAVTLSAHTADSSQRIATHFKTLPEVQEAYAMTGEMDYYLKVVTRDLKSLSSFINDKLLAHDSIQNVKTSVALDTLKETSFLPV